MFAGKIQISGGRAVNWEWGSRTAKIVSSSCLTRHLAAQRKGKRGQRQERDIMSGAVVLVLFVHLFCDGRI